MGGACRQAALILVCVGLVLSVSASAQDSTAGQADKGEGTSGCYDPSCCGTGGYGAADYGPGTGAGAGAEAGGGGVPDSFDAFGAAGGAGAAGTGAG